MGSFLQNMKICLKPWKLVEKLGKLWKGGKFSKLDKPKIHVMLPRWTTTQITQPFFDFIVYHSRKFTHENSSSWNRIRFEGFPSVFHAFSLTTTTVRIMLGPCEARKYWLNEMSIVTTARHCFFSEFSTVFHEFSFFLWIKSIEATAGKSNRNYEFLGLALKRNEISSLCRRWVEQMREFHWQNCFFRGRDSTNWRPELK